MRKHVACLRFVPVVVALVPWAYNRRDPALLGIPFFYWFQLALVPVGSAILWWLIVLDRAPRDDPNGGPPAVGGAGR